MGGTVEGPLFLGIDLGTSSCKVVLVTSRGKVIGGASASYPLMLSEGGGAEQDPEAWWKAIASASSKVLAKSGSDPARISAVGATGQWSGTVAVDRQGAPLRPAIIWMDTRGEPQVRSLTSGFPSVSGYRVDKLLTWVRRTGGAPAHSGKDSLAHILYLREKEPEVYRKAFRFLEPKDYLNLRLTGTFTASWDHTVVTWVTDNRDPSDVRYDPRLLRLAGIDGGKLPTLHRSTDVIGTTTATASAQLGIPPGTRVVAGAGDMQASLIGTGCTSPFQFHLYLGTSSWLTAHVPFQRTDVFHNMASFPSAIPGSYLIVATQESAGGALGYARDLLFGTGADAPTFAEVDAWAARARPAEGSVIVAPWLYGERAPVEDRDLRGAVFNLSLGSGRAQVLRAVMEGVAYNTRWILDPVERLAGRRADPIRVAGGGANSALWCQVLSDVLDRRVDVVEEPAYATARGAALLGAVGVGASSFAAIAGAPTVVRSFAPRSPNVKLYDRMFAKFLRFHRVNAPLFRELNSDR
jgi:xylulokinase